MQHDHVLAFDILTGPPALGEWGICGQNICYHVAAIRDSIQFDLLTPSLGFLGERFCEQNMCCHVAAFVILFNLICTMTIF